MAETIRVTVLPVDEYGVVSLEALDLQLARILPVIDEVKGLYRQGTREIVLTGIETGSYGRDFEEKYTYLSFSSLREP